MSFYLDFIKMLEEGAARTASNLDKDVSRIVYETGAVVVGVFGVERMPFDEFWGLEHESRLPMMQAGVGRSGPGRAGVIAKKITSGSQVTEDVIRQAMKNAPLKS